MADEQRLKVIIEATSAGLTDALKHATSAVNGSTASWKTRLDEAQASIRTAQDAVKNLGETAKSLRDANVDISGIPGMIDRINQAGGSLEGLRADIDQAVDGLSRLRAEGSSLGIGFEEYQRLSEVLGEVGMSSEQLRAMMTQMQASVQGLANGVPEAVEVFGRLGVSLQDLASRSPVGQMEEIAAAVNSISDPLVKAETSNRLFATSMEEVIRLGEAYRSSIELGTGGTFATDADLNRLVQMQNQLNGLQSSLAGVQQQAAEPVSMPIEERIHEAMQVLNAFSDTMRDMRERYVADMRAMGDETQRDTLQSADAWRRYVEQVQSMLDGMRDRATRAGVNGTESSGAAIDVAAGLAFQNMIEALEAEIQNLRRSAESAAEAGRQSSLNAIDSIMMRLNQMGRMFGEVFRASGNTRALEQMNAGIVAATRNVEALAERMRGLNQGVVDAANRLAGFGERISGSFREAGRSIVSFFQHPLQSVHDGILRTMDAVNGLGSASAQAGRQGASNARQIIGMLAGVASIAGGVVKAIKMIGGFIKGYWIDPMKEAWKDMLRMSEYQLGVNKGVYGPEADRWKNAKQELQEYYELLKKAQSEEGTSEDREKERQARRNLERRYAIEINPDSADMRIAVGRELDKAQANYVKALEGQERELAKAQEEAQKALERVTSYWKSGIWYGGNWNAYQADVLSVQDKINALAKEYDSVRQQLHQARKETAGEDFRRIEGAKIDDKAREARRKEAERAGKSFEEKAKKREDATEELDKWASETMKSEGQRRLDEIYDRYEKLLLAGVPKSQADPIRDKAIKKELERQAKEDAEALKREADEHNRHLDALQQANEREEDARRRMLDAYRAWYEAQERQTYELRLDRLGKAQERLRKKIDSFGFSLPNGFKSSRPNMSPRSRRRLRMDDRIADKLARRQSGEHVHFSRREMERIKELERLQRKGRNLSAEEKAIRAAQQQDAAAKTMKSASDAFWEAVKAFYKAQTGKDLESKNEQRARERKESREKRNRENEEARSKPARSRKWSEGPSGVAPNPKPAEPKPGPKPAPRPRPRPRPAAVEEGPAPKKLDRDEYARRYGGDPARLDDYYRKYSESYDRRHGVKRDAGRINAGLANSISRLYAPPRYADTGAGTRDYTSLLERIETAIKNNKGNLTLK